MRPNASDQFDEIGERAREPIDLVNHHHVDQAILDVLQAAVAARPHDAVAKSKSGLLKGLLYSTDGTAFSPTHTRKGGKLYRYYVSQTVLKHGAGFYPVEWRAQNLAFRSTAPRALVESADDGGYTLEFRLAIAPPRRMVIVVVRDMAQYLSSACIQYNQKRTQKKP